MANPALEAFAANTQNTHNKYASASIAAFLDSLRQKYLSHCSTTTEQNHVLQRKIDVFGNYISRP
jgi:hypothetical protein